MANNGKTTSNDATIKRILTEKARRAAFPNAVAAYLASLIPAQRAFIDDPSKRKLTHAPRRAGKTHALVGLALKTALAFPDATIPLVERSMSCQAADEFWRGLQEIDAEYRLGIKWQHTLRIATFPNKARLIVMGADTAEASDKVRGGKYPLVLVDECGAFRSEILSYLVTDVCEAATMDYDGVIVMAGTPNLTKKGFFWSAKESGGWSVHHWSSIDNTALPLKGMEGRSEEDRRQWRVDWLANLRKRLGWTEETSTYVREYLGQWTDATDDRMYGITPANILDRLPDAKPSEWTYVLAIDIGYTEPCAITVWGRIDGDPHLYVVEEFERAQLVPSALAAHVERFRARYDPISIVVDSGGMGKGYATEMQETYGIPCEAANKQGKLAHVDFANGDLASGRIRILKSCKSLIEDLSELPWNEERTDAAKGYDDHLPDSFLYGHGRIRKWADTGLGDPDAPQRGEPAWWLAEVARMEADEEARITAHVSEMREDSHRNDFGIFEPLDDY